jgi:hypothetical protein
MLLLILLAPLLADGPDLCSGPGAWQDGAESVMIISCVNALWVVMHYYAQGNFERCNGRDGASQKSRTCERKGG